jgi:hypothetical protein
MLTNSNGTGGLANSGQTAVELGVTNLKYGVSHIDTAQVSQSHIYIYISISFPSARDLVFFFLVMTVLISRDTEPRNKLEKLSKLLEPRGILSGLPPRVSPTWRSRKYGTE